MSPTPVQIGWTAGIIDGEGCISAHGQNRLHYPGKIWSLKVNVTSTDPRIVYRLQDLWGGKVWPRAKPKNPNHTRAWCWVVCGQEACEVLSLIRNELVIKQEQADLAVQFGELLNTSRDTRKVGEGNLLRREKLAEQLKLAKVVA